MGMIMHDDVPYGEGTSYTPGTGIAINNNIIAVDADNTPTENSEKPVKSKGVYSALESNSAKSASLLKSTVGWTGKNLLPNNFINQTINGVTCTKDTKGIINLNGTCTGTTFRRIYIGNIPNGTYNLSDNIQNHNDCNLYINAIKLDGTTAYGIAGTNSNPILNADNTLYKEYDIGLYLKDGIQFSNLKVYPMLRDASITDDTYEPYHESVETMYEEEIHGVNLLKNTATTQTVNGVTFTVNADGSVTANGTATANTFLIVYPNTVTNKYENNIINGCPAGGNASTSYCISVRVGLQSNDSHVRSVDDIGNGAVIPKVNTSTEWIRFYIRIANGYTANNLVFKPMIRKAEIEDSTYRPYNPQAIQNQLNNQTGVLGAKNLLPYTRDSSTYTQSDVTYTRNADGSITANGTATANSFIPIAERLKYPINNLKKGVEYILSGDYGLGSGNGYVYVNFYNGSTRIGGVNAGGNGSVKFNIPESVNGTVVDGIDFGIGVLNGKTVNNFTFYPMLRLASDPDDTYVPYAMTNRELTEKVDYPSIKEPKLLTSSNNLDDIRTAGYYLIQGSAPTNSPEGLTWYILEVQNIGGDCIQIVRKSLGTSSIIYQRGYNGSPISWKSWYKFTGTVVS